MAKLDLDRTRREELADEEEELWPVSESGVYAPLLLHVYHSENRSLRQ
jgi:hypothetical protein